MRGCIYKIVSNICTKFYRYRLVKKLSGIFDIIGKKKKNREQQSTERSEREREKR